MGRSYPLMVGLCTDRPLPHTLAFLSLPQSKVDPIDDIDVINLELALSDLVQIEKRLERLGKGRN